MARSQVVTLLTDFGTRDGYVGAMKGAILAVCPKANIPSTTALATLNSATGRELGLERGANVIMPNLTPTKYRALYQIYPDKACINETADACHTCIKGRIGALGRRIGTGRGDSPNHAGDDAMLEATQRSTQPDTADSLRIL